MTNDRGDFGCQPLSLFYKISMDHEHLVLGECWYTIRYKSPVFVVRILKWGLRTRDIYNMLIFSKIKKCHVRTQRSTPSYVICTGSILPESLPYISYRLASRGYFHGRAFGMGEWFEEDAYSVFEEGRVRFGLDGLLLPGHQGHIAV